MIMLMNIGNLIFIFCIVLDIRYALRNQYSAFASYIAIPATLSAFNPAVVCFSLYCKKRNNEVKHKSVNLTTCSKNNHGLSKGIGGNSNTEI